jgi:hypothetical protein
MHTVNVRASECVSPQSHHSAKIDMPVDERGSHKLTVLSHDPENTKPSSLLYSTHRTALSCVPNTVEEPDATSCLQQGEIIIVRYLAMMHT